LTSTISRPEGNNFLDHNNIGESDIFIPVTVAHTTFDLAAGKEVGENWSVGVNAVNVANTRVLLDNSLTFGGFHENDPRQIYGEVRYRFHF
jgi:outer membrane receptor protein involved in Fe transport